MADSIADSDPVGDKVKSIIAEKLDQKVEDLKFETKFAEDLGADSLDAAEIIMEVEDRFDMKIPDEASNKMKTIGEVVAYVEANKK